MIQRESVPITSDELCDLIGTDDAIRRKLVEDLFFQLDEQEQGRLLAYFCTDDRESYDESPTIDHVDFDDKDQGTIEVSFTGSVYMGCRDLNYVNEHNETLKFGIDRDEARIWFESEPPDKVDRPPDDC
jgi:hypothetical protein